MTAPCVSVVLKGHVATVLFDAPPHNYVSLALLKTLADTLEALDAELACRAVVLKSNGNIFCAGADFSDPDLQGPFDPRPLYAQAMRLFTSGKPIVAAVQGAAIGAGLGLALAADFRIGCPQSRFVANFTRLGLHPGFGLSYTLPALVGGQMASRMFFTGERISAERALAHGLLDGCVEGDRLDEAAHAFALEIAHSAPLAVQLVRQTLRADLPQRVKAANQRECALQLEQFGHADFHEGVAASSARRLPRFADRQLASVSGTRGEALQPIDE